MNTESSATIPRHPQQIDLLNGALPIDAEPFRLGEHLPQQQEIATDMEEDVHGGRPN